MEMAEYITSLNACSTAPSVIRLRRAIAVALTSGVNSGSNNNSTCFVCYKEKRIRDNENTQ